MNKKLTTISTLTVVLAILVTVFLPTSVASATQYGSKDTADTDTFWYFGENHLNVNGIKESVAKWVSGADKSNPVVIGVIDTGLNHTHEIFEKTDTLYKVDGKVQGYNAFVASSASGVSNPTEDQLSNVVDQTTTSHGTAIASILAMLIYETGLQDYVKIYPIKASRDESLSFPDSSVAEGLSFVNRTKDTIGIDVVNIAICGYVEADYAKHQSLFLSTSANAVIVSAAGNDGYASSSKKAYPASLDGVLSVMGYGRNGSKYMGSNGATGSNFGDYDLTAPAEDVYVAKGASDSYTTIDGTSAATAFVSFVSAVVALREQTAGSDTNATVIARHLATSSTKTDVVYGNYKLPKFEAYGSVNNAITETYLEPTGITISNDKGLTSGAEIYRGQHGTITLSADFAPYGNVNPTLARDIRWTQTEILFKPVLDDDGKETGTFEESAGETVEIGTGKSIAYTPDRKGTYVVKATYIKGETTLEASFRYTLNYVAYDTVAGIMQVSPVGGLEGATETAGTIFAGDSVVFELSKAEVLDPDVAIKWYVNGEYAGTGDTLTFGGTKNGTYVISAQYGEYRTNENVYTLTVKSAFFKTEVWVSVTAVIVVIAIVAVVFAVLQHKKKKGQKA